MALLDEHVVELVVGTLATYQYSLDKAWALRDALLSSGLCDPATVVAMDVADIGNALKAAGYDRGGITYIIAPRVRSLMEAVQAGTLDSIAEALSSGDQDAFSETLCSVKGFGPKAAFVAWQLMAPTRSEARQA
ncbi:MAG: hypothetical protein P1P71_08970 [Anaerosomatales bacterium]|nr:hypothetical protein [Anaerosomatales bacterium]